MLTITIPESEFYDEAKGEFINFPEATLDLEHSLVSISKWESKWEKPFMGDDVKTTEQTLDYIRCMTLNPNVPPEVYDNLRDEHFKKVNEYIDAKMTATWFNDPKTPQGKKEVVTSEVIYYWMISLTIPFECQHWHLNRLITLIRVCGQKNSPEKSKRMSKSELAARNRALNEKRRAQMKSQG